MARIVDGDKIIEALNLIAKCWSVSPFVSKEEHSGAVNMLREVEREIKESTISTQPNELTCEGCIALGTSYGPCMNCIRSKPRGDMYRRPPEKEV